MSLEQEVQASQEKLRAVETELTSLQHTLSSSSLQNETSAKEKVQSMVPVYTVNTLMKREREGEREDEDEDTLIK